MVMDNTERHEDTQESQLENNNSPLISRRNVLKGALASGVILAMAGTGKAFGVFKDGTSVLENSDKNRISASIEDIAKAASETNPDVQEAIKEGKINLENNLDWEKYFVAITAEQAKQIIELADTLGFEGLLLPFDPRSSTNLSLSNSSRVADGIEQSVIIAKNFKSGTRAYSPFSGELSVIDANIGQVPVTEFSFDRKSFKRGVMRGAELKIPTVERARIIMPMDNLTFVNAQNDVEIGFPVATISENKRLIDSLGKSELIIQLGKATNIDDKQTRLRDDEFSNDVTLGHLFTFNGKIAFLETMPLVVGGRMGSGSKVY